MSESPPPCPLADLGDPYNHPFGNQHQAFYSSVKDSPLFKLPREIRDVIYQMVYTNAQPYMPQFQATRGGGPFPRIYESRNWRNNPKHLAKSNLLMTCKAIKHEATVFLYQNAVVQIPIGFVRPKRKNVLIPNVAELSAQSVVVSLNISIDESFNDMTIIEKRLQPLYRMPNLRYCHLRLLCFWGFPPSRVRITLRHLFTIHSKCLIGVENIVLSCGCAGEEASPVGLPVEKRLPWQTPGDSAWHDQNHELCMHSVRDELENIFGLSRELAHHETEVGPRLLFYPGASRATAPLDWEKIAEMERATDKVR